MRIKNRKPEESDRGTKRSSLWKRYLIVMLAVLMHVVTGIAYNAARRTGDPVKNVREAEKEPAPFPENMPHKRAASHCWRAHLSCFWKYRTLRR